MNKSQIRCLTLEKRKNILDRREKSNRIAENIKGFDKYKNAKIIAAYYSIGDEVETGVIIEDILKSGKTLCLPVIISNGIMEFRRTDMTNLKEGIYSGIFEPDNSCQRVEINEIDLFLVPGVAFDLNGCRVGYGKGYYDRVLAKQKRTGCSIALAFCDQIIDKIEKEPHDVAIDYIATEKGILAI